MGGAGGKTEEVADTLEKERRVYKWSDRAGSAKEEQTGGKVERERGRATG